MTQPADGPSPVRGLTSTRESDVRSGRRGGAEPKTEEPAT